MFVTTAQIIGDYYRLARMVNNQGYFAVQVKTPLSSTVLSQVQTVTPPAYSCEPDDGTGVQYVTMSQLSC